MNNGNPNIQVLKANETGIFTNYIYKTIPLAFDESMSYYECLCGLLSYLKNTVIPALNNNADAVIELQDKVIELNDLFIELKSYVDNYFENLDVQEEINNKLDEMVEDGTLLNLITPLVNDTINSLTTEVRTEVSDMEKEIGSNVLNPYRYDYYRSYSPAENPDNFLTSTFFNNFKISSNGEGKYSVNYNINDFKNESTNTWYISPNGNNSNSGADSEHPKQDLSAILNSTSAGDTVIFMDGIYRKNGFALDISKSLNLIAEHSGKVWCKTGDDYSYTKVDGYNNVYTVTRTAVTKIYDISKREEGIIIPLTLVNSIQDVDDTPSSYYINGSEVYLSLYDDVIPSNDTIDIALTTGRCMFQITGINSDAKIYIEGINILDANNGGVLANNTTNYNYYITLKDCKFYNVISASYAYDGFSNKGCFSICDHVEIYNGGKDGFNYHVGTYKQAIGIEIDCIANNFGYGRTSQSQLSNNASTAHDYSEVIRVNGNYSYCNGGVIADVNNAKSLNYGCYIFDSYGQSYDVLAQTTTVVYLFDCYLKGSRANTNLLSSGDNAYIYYKNTKFDRKTGANVISIDD